MGSIRSLKRNPRPSTGASTGPLACSVRLAEEVFGAAAEQPGFALFAYMWRRFGPPPMQADQHKTLGARWVLTTPMTGVWVRVEPRASAMCFAFGYLVTPEIEREVRRPADEWRARYFAVLEAHLPPDVDPSDEDAFYVWVLDSPPPEAQPGLAEPIAAMGPMPREREHPLCAEVQDALRATMRSLTYPVWVRDVAFDARGRRG